MRVKEPKIDVFYNYPDTDLTTPVVIESECFTVLVECANGDVYYLTVWTDDYFTRIREQARLSGACLAGGYIVLPDLIIASGNIEFILQVFNDLARTNGLQDSWLIPDELTGLWGYYDGNDEADDTNDDLHWEDVGDDSSTGADYGATPAYH